MIFSEAQVQNILQKFYLNKTVLVVLLGKEF